MADFIVIVILVFAVAAACIYMYKSKKAGKKCIGCPYSDSCSRDKCSKK